MVAVTVITATAHQETAKQAIVKRLRESGATSAAMPASLEIGDENERETLDELLATGTVREARRGLFYIAKEKRSARHEGIAFRLLLLLLVTLSIAASAVTMVLAAV